MKILFEDRDILVVNKPGGLLTVATDKDKQNNALMILMASQDKVFTVHRLDRDTSGVLIFAKSLEAKKRLQENWSQFKKRYMAVVNGSLSEKEGTIKTYLAENKIHRMYSVQDPSKGQLAITEYRVLRESDRYSLLQVELKTGKKNQIRVHFSEMGHPVSGDKKYGEKEKGPRRLALHAHTLTIKHPFSGEEMTFEAGLPGYFNDLMDGKIRKETAQIEKKSEGSRNPAEKHRKIRRRDTKNKGKRRSPKSRA